MPDQPTAVLAVDSFPNPFTPTLIVDNQAFNFCMTCETAADAEWFCDQIRIALTRAGCRVAPKESPPTE